MTWWQYVFKSKIEYEFSLNIKSIEKSRAQITLIVLKKWIIVCRAKKTKNKCNGMEWNKIKWTEMKW